MSNAFEKWFKKHLPKSYSDKQRNKVWDDICKKIREKESWGVNPKQGASHE